MLKTIKSIIRETSVFSIVCFLVVLVCVALMTYLFAIAANEHAKEMKQDSMTARPDIVLPSSIDGVHVISIDNHEYLYINCRRGGLAHKADCKYCGEKQHEKNN